MAASEALSLVKRLRKLSDGRKLPEYQLNRRVRYNCNWNPAEDFFGWNWFGFVRLETRFGRK